MNKIIINILTIILLSIISCDNTKFHQVVDDSINEYVLIDLGNSLKFNWDLSDEKIVNDLLLGNLKKDFNKKRILLISKIRDVTPTCITICGSNQKLKNGDLAFLLFDKIENVKYYKGLNIQMDSFIIGCQYPENFIEIIDNRRMFIVERLIKLEKVNELN